jgi:hypothetical protein
MPRALTAIRAYRRLAGYSGSAVVVAGTIVGAWLLGAIGTRWNSA